MSTYSGRWPRSTALVFALLSMVAAPALAEKKLPTPVLVYAIAFENCNYSALGYDYQMADTSNYREVKSAVQDRLAKKHPNAKGVRSASSKYEFGDNAGAVAFIEIDTTDAACKSRAIIVKFGVDVADAAARAKAEAKGRPYRTIFQEYFVKITTAPTPAP